LITIACYSSPEIGDERYQLIMSSYLNAWLGIIPVKRITAEMSTFTSPMLSSRGEFIHEFRDPHVWHLYSNVTTTQHFLLLITRLGFAGKQIYRK